MRGYISVLSAAFINHSNHRHIIATHVDRQAVGLLGMDSDLRCAGPSGKLLSFVATRSKSTMNNQTL